MPGSDHWNEEDHGQMMVVVMMFCWHLAACLTIMLAIGAVVYWTSFRSEHYQLVVDCDPEDARGGRRFAAVPAAVTASGVRDYHDDEFDSDVEHVYMKNVATTHN